MENVRNRQNIRLATSWKQASKLINKPSFQRAEVFSENFCAIHLNKESIEMDKPIYIVTSFLDLSKLLMCDYFFNNRKKRFVEGVNLLHMDTDSYILKINMEGISRICLRMLVFMIQAIINQIKKLFSTKNK